MNRDHTCGQLRKQDAGKNVKLAGWVAKRRNLGSIVFIDLRDRYGATEELVTQAFKDNEFRSNLTLKNVGDTLKKWHDQGVKQEATIVIDFITR